jgi:hypothetical protein
MIAIYALVDLIMNTIWKSTPLVMGACVLFLSSCTTAATQQDANPSDSGPTTLLVKTKREIKQGELIAPDALYETPVPSGEAPPGAAGSASIAAGQTATRDLPKDHALVNSDFNKQATPPPAQVAPVPQNLPGEENTPG